jgi:hypothetical protein
MGAKVHKRIGAGNGSDSNPQILVVGNGCWCAQYTSTQAVPTMCVSRLPRIALQGHSLVLECASFRRQAPSLLLPFQSLSVFTRPPPPSSPSSPPPSPTPTSIIAWSTRHHRCLHTTSSQPHFVIGGGVVHQHPMARRTLTPSNRTGVPAVSFGLRWGGLVCHCVRACTFPHRGWSSPRPMGVSGSPHRARVPMARHRTLALRRCVCPDHPHGSCGGQAGRRPDRRVCGRGGALGLGARFDRRDGPSH